MTLNSYDFGNNIIFRWKPSQARYIKYFTLIYLSIFLQGIGKATALRLAKAGAKVIATDISIEGLKSLDGIEGMKTRTTLFYSVFLINKGAHF